MNDTLAIIQRITALEREVARLATIEDPPNSYLAGVATITNAGEFITYSATYTTLPILVTQPTSVSGFTTYTLPTTSGFHLTLLDTSHEPIAGTVHWAAFGTRETI